LNFILAIIPIAIILYLMVGRRWGAASAGGMGYLSALLVSIAFFGAGPQLLAFAHARALLLSIDVLLIIWAAFLLYRVVDEAGAIRTIGSALPHLTPDRGVQALIIGWVFATFLQGVGGFGVPVAVIAPILVGLGFAPLTAVLLPSIGHGWAVTFGSLGSSFQALIASTGLPGESLAGPSALFLGISGLLVGIMVAQVSEGWRAVQRLLPSILILGFGMGVTQYLVAISGLWNIAAFMGGLAGLVIAFPLAVRSRKSAAQNSSASANGRLDLRALLIAISGYAILVVVTLSIQLIPVLRNGLSQFVIQVNFPEVSTASGYVTAAGTGRAIPLFRHAGASLFYASVLAYLVYNQAHLYKPGAVRRIATGTIQRVMSSSVSIASMVAMAVIMENSGMTDTLARGLAEGTGAVFPLVSPWIGALGAFMTGSNTNSNVVFGALQLRTAELLGFAAPIILAAQTAGAALASVMAPTKVVVGASTAGMAGKEGEVMRQMVRYTVPLVLLISLLAAAFVWLT
jgi:lactate permease